MKERYQEIDEKNEALREYLSIYKSQGKDFLDRFEMSWIYHDAALEGTIYTPQELAAALNPGQAPIDASLLPIVWEIKNHKVVCDFIRQEAQTNGKKQAPVTLATVKRMHELFSGNTPEAQMARILAERRERTEKELAKEREKSGYRKDMPLHRTYFHDIAQPGKIPSLLEKWGELVASTEFRESHPIKQAATIQFQLIQIFPFIEHSGKIGRMCSNLILFRHHYMPCVIHSIDRQKYYESFKGNINNFRLLLLEAMENSLDNSLKFFQELGRRRVQAVH